MEWKCAKTDKPSKEITALVSNEKGWMGNLTRALYCPRADVWRLYDPSYRETILLDVTHYFPIPMAPLVQW